MNAKGDIEVDYHHLVEDLGIVLGTAFAQALGTRGITRYGEMTLPMDEALLSVYLDISGRAGYHGNLAIPTQKVGDFDIGTGGRIHGRPLPGHGAEPHIVQHRGTNPTTSSRAFSRPWAGR